MWVLVVYLTFVTANEPRALMQEFDSQKTCQAAGNRMWELSGRTAKWSCMKK